MDAEDKFLIHAFVTFPETPGLSQNVQRLAEAKFLTSPSIPMVPNSYAHLAKLHI